MKSDQQHTDRSRTKNSVLYKYLDIEGAKMMLSNRTLQFTNAMQFNDPFDCDPNLIDFSKVPYERCKTWTSDIIESLAFDQYRKNREDVWVCCLSKVFDSLLMWAYYNNHRGVCIGLNMEKVAKYFDASLGQIVDKHAHEVQYRDIIENRITSKTKKISFIIKCAQKLKSGNMNKKHVCLFSILFHGLCYLTQIIKVI